MPGPDLEVEPAGYLVAMDRAVRIHFLDWGGPAGAGAPGILLVHGLRATAWSWAAVARRLRGVARVAAMDLRGHGLSDAPTHGYELALLAGDAVAVAEGAGIAALPGEPAAGSLVVAGHGFGAIVGAHAAAALGERCAGLVLVDGGWEEPEATGLDPAEWLQAIEEPPEVLRSLGAFLADREAIDPASWDADAERAARVQVVEQPSGRVVSVVRPHALEAFVGAMLAHDPGAVLPGLRTALVALVARDDDGTRTAALRSVAAARAAAGQIPVRAGSFPDLGHDLLRRTPAAVAAAILGAVPQGPAGDGEAARLLAPPAGSTG